MGFLLGDSLMMMNHFGDDESQKLLGEDRIEPSFERQGTEARDLPIFAFGIGSRQTDLGFVPAHSLGDLEPLGQQMDQRRVDVVDAGAIRGELIIGHDAANASFRTMADLPLLFVDHPFPDLYRDLVDGRAALVGLGTDDGLDIANAIIAGATRPWNADAFALAPNLTVISRVGVGYDNVNVADAAAAGVVVCNAPLAPMVSTAEHTLALMFAVSKHLPHQIARAKSGLPGEPVGRSLELDGKTLGLVGLGRIACRVAVAAQALGMEVIAADPVVEESPVAGVTIVSFAELLATSDVISLHAPALESTYHLIDADTLAAMKPGAYLVNCARGVLVDHDALLAAIDSGHIAGAGLDVTQPEPLPAGHPLLDRSNVVITPHIASASVAGRRRLYEHAIDNALAVLEGRPATVVAPPA